MLIEPVPSIDFGADTLINTGTFYTIIPVITGAESYLWNNLAVEPLLAVSYPGWYSLTVSSAGGCSTNDSVYISFIAQVENHFQQALKVYPNPVSEFLHVEISSSQSGTLAIYNSLGLPVNRQKVNGYETTINVQSFSDGIYFIRWENEDRECWMSRFSVVR